MPIRLPKNIRLAASTKRHCSRTSRGKPRQDESRAHWPQAGCGVDTAVDARATPVAAMSRSGNCCNHAPGPVPGVGRDADNRSGNCRPVCGFARPAPAARAARANCSHSALCRRFEKALLHVGPNKPRAMPLSSATARGAGTCKGAARIEASSIDPGLGQSGLAFGKPEDGALLGQRQGERRDGGAATAGSCGRVSGCSR